MIVSEAVISMGKIFKPTTLGRRRSRSSVEMYLQHYRKAEILTAEILVLIIVRHELLLLFSKLKKKTKNTVMI